MENINNNVDLHLFVEGDEFEHKTAARAFEVRFTYFRFGRFCFKYRLKDSHFRSEWFYVDWSLDAMNEYLASGDFKPVSLQQFNKKLGLFEDKEYEEMFV